MSKQAMTEILAAVANGEGAADTDTVAISLGALRALVRQEPTGYVFSYPGGDAFAFPRQFKLINELYRASARPLYAAPVVAGQAVPDVCRQALEDACVVSWISADLSTLDGAKKAINDLCAFEAKLAVDPAVNGGYTLVPTTPSQDVLIAMLEAFGSGAGSCGEHSGHSLSDALDAYQAMLAAAKKQGDAE